MDIIISISITVDEFLGVGTNVDRLIFCRCHDEFWEVAVTYRSYLPGLPGILQCTDIQTMNTYLDTVAYRGGVFKHPPPNSEGPLKSCQIQPDCENC